jgi:hypothetical protein
MITVERDLLNTQISKTIKESKKIIKVVAVSSAQAERTCLMNNIASDRRNALLAENISHLMAVKILKKL